MSGLHRYGVISDIHGHLVRLDTVLSNFQHTGVAQVLCLGDLITFGPDSPGVIDRICSLPNCTTVLGNHDLHLNHPPYPSLERAERIARQYSGAQMEFIDALPTLAVVNERLILTHRTLDPNDEEIRYQEQAERCWRRLQAQYPAARACFFGHTHLQTYFDGDDLIFPEAPETFTLPTDRPVLINPGSVGMPRDGGSDFHCAVFDLAAGQVTFEEFWLPPGAE